MHPILGRIPNTIIHSWTIVYAVVIGAWLLWLGRKARHQSAWWRVWDAPLAALAGAIVGGRLHFVVINWAWFQDNLADIVRFTQGGLLYHGALLGGLIGYVAACGGDTDKMLFFGLRRRPKNNIWKMTATLNGITAFIIVLHIAGWFACYLDACAWGRPTLLAWYSADLPDGPGVFAVRYQTQLLGAAWCTLVLLLDRLRPHAPNRFWRVLILILIGRLLVTPLRGDTMPTFYEIRLDTWLDYVLIFCTLGVLAIYNRQAITT